MLLGEFVQGFGFDSPFLLSFLASQHHLENGKHCSPGFSTLSLEPLTSELTLACVTHGVLTMTDLCVDTWDLRSRESRFGALTFLMGYDVATFSFPAPVGGNNFRDHPDKLMRLKVNGVCL